MKTTVFPYSPLNFLLIAALMLSNPILSNPLLSAQYDVNHRLNNAGPKTGGPSPSEIKQAVEKSLISAYEDHFFGVKNKITFEWKGGIVVGQPETRLRTAQSCYPVKLNVKVTITDPRDGNTSILTRGIEANIAGYHKIEIFCFYKNGFGEWDFGTYEQ